MYVIPLLLMASVLSLIGKSTGHGGPYECAKILFIHHCKDTHHDVMKMDIQVKRMKMARCIQGTWSSTEEFHDGFKIKALTSQEDGGTFKHFYTLDIKKPLTSLQANLPFLHTQLTKTWGGAPFPAGNYSLPCIRPCFKVQAAPELPYGHFMTKVIMYNDKDQAIGCMKVESRVEALPVHVAGKKLDVKKWQIVTDELD